MRTVDLLRSVILGSTAFAPLAASADDAFEKQKEALAEIRLTANEICTKIPVEGSGVSVKLTGEAEAELNLLLKKLVDIGIEGAGEASGDNYTNVLREQLAASIGASDQCRLTVFKDLSNRLLGSPFDTSINNSGISTTTLPPQYTKDFGTTQYSNKFFHGIVMTASQNTEPRSRITASVLIKNVSSESVFLIHKQHKGGAIDDKGQSYEIRAVQGVNSYSTASQNNITTSDWTALTPGSVQTIVFVFTAEDGNRYQDANVASFAVDFWIATQKTYASISIGFSNVALLG